MPGVLLDIFMQSPPLSNGDPQFEELVTWGPSKLGFNNMLAWATPEWIAVPKQNVKR
jgi:hypothetical protein